MDEDDEVAWSEGGLEDGPPAVARDPCEVALAGPGLREPDAWRETFDDFVWVEPSLDEGEVECTHPDARPLGRGCYICPDCHTIYCTFDPGPPPPNCLFNVLQVVDFRARVR